MANQTEVKKYLAHWFQLGKKVVVGNEGINLLPQPIYQGDRYSKEFEECWQKILLSASDCYLEGTHETIAELLTPSWEMSPCSRCLMPIPMRNVGMPALLCPCSNLPGWPNTELPNPRCPITDQEQLKIICDRLGQNLSSARY
ncbi:MAG TPA: hypothetical protein IGS40_09470 [Trichormus sp. M33_DOE_039]|nr:hypothetical protein [Trichormus sp. M33_DOE_039]